MTDASIPATSKKLNVDAPAWTPSFGGATGASGGLSDLALPGTNHPTDVNNTHNYPTNNEEGGEYDGQEYDEHGEMDDYYEGEFVTDHAEYEKADHTDWHQHQQWATMMEQQQQQQFGFSNAAHQSGGASGLGLPPPPASLFPGGKMPQTPEEWEKFNTELREMQKKQIDKQIEERKAREEAKRARDAKSGKSSNLANAPLTVNGKHRWPKNTAAKKAEVAQKAAFESFANALLHAVSPFMPPLRKQTKTSLPHIKVDQRFGRRGQPETAVMQFIVAPVVVNYKPAHFHEVSPGDLMEFHYDFSLVLSQLRTANSVAFSYGPAWKPFQLPYCFVGCREYAKEVRHLCPDEVPNGRSEAVYEDDVVKDITAVICAVQELEPLSRMSFVDAMKSRVNLVAMYDVYNSLFEQIGDYQIQVRNLNSSPSQYLLKTSLQVLQKSCQMKPKAKAAQEKNPDDFHLTPQSFEVSIGGDSTVWDELPTVANTFQSGKTVVVSVDPEEEEKKKVPLHLAVTKAPESSVPKSATAATSVAASSAKASAAVTANASGVTSSQKAASSPAVVSSPSSSSPKVSPGAALAVVAACVAVTAVTVGVVMKNKNK